MISLLTKQKLAKAAGLAVALFIAAMNGGAAAETAEGDTGALTIVSGGVSRAVIVVPERASSVEKHAANTLAEYVKKSTGAELPVVTKETVTEASKETAMPTGSENQTGAGSGTEAEVHGGTPDAATSDAGRIVIEVGMAHDDPRSEAMLQGMKEDGFVIRPYENGLVIAGPAPSGTANGVYAFLERFVGVRWLMPGPDGEDVPQLADLVVPLREVKEEPAFFSRMLGSGPTPPNAQDWNDWLDRNRLEGHIRFQHNLVNLFPPSVYGSSHPEFYPTRGGQRYIPPDDAAAGWQPCFTAPGLAEEAIAAIVRYFDEHPEERSYSLAVNDGGGFCEAQPDHPDYPGKLNSLGLPDMSDLYYRWVNRVVEGVLRVHPDKWFGVLAYDEVYDPPSFPLHPRVVPFVTKDRLSWADRRTAADDKALLAEWRSKSANVAWYDYLYGSPHLVPRMYVHLMADNYRYASRLGVVAHYGELYPNWGEGPKPWIAAKLMWDPQLDADGLLREWCERAVGSKAAPDLVAYYAIWEKFWTKTAPRTSWFEGSKTSTYLAFDSADYLEAVSRKDIADSRRLLESAAAKAATEPQKARARILLQAFDYYEASVLSYPRPQPSPTSSARALSMLDQVERDLISGEAMRQTRFSFIERHRSDPMLALPLDPNAYSPAWSAWSPETFWRLADYIRTRERKGGPVRKRIDAMAQNAPAPIRQYARLLQSAGGGARSLVANGSFDIGKSSAAHWTHWIAHTGTIRRVTERAGTGPASLKLEGVDRGGPAQVVRVEPGLLAARVKYAMSERYIGKGKIGLTLNLRDGNGSLLASLRAPAVRLAARSGAWNDAVAIFDVPESVDGKRPATGQFVVVAERLSGSAAALYLDDVELYQSADVQTFKIR
jgi:hypothetical protein